MTMYIARPKIHCAYPLYLTLFFLLAKGVGGGGHGHLHFVFLWPKGRGGGDHIHTLAFLIWEREGVRVTMVRYSLPLPKTEDGWLPLLGKGRFGDHLHAHSFLFWEITDFL